MVPTKVKSQCIFGGDGEGERGEDKERERGEKKDTHSLACPGDGQSYMKRDSNLAHGSLHIIAWS